MSLKALCILTIYNEIKFLPYKIAWARENGLDIYVIDNYSEDSSYEWLKYHNIPCHQIDTKDSFDLRILQNEIIKTTDWIKPDWIVYNGADLFIFANELIRDLCEKAENIGFNMIGFPMIDVCNTGEKGGHPFRTYFYYRHSRNLIAFIYKWELGIKYKADAVLMPGRKVLSPPGIMINYGRTKSKQERQILLERRQKAWDNGLDRTSGRHYLREQAKDWKWDISELKDLRNSEYWKYIKPYQC